jgi:site-specific recombinase XerC
MAAAFGKVRTHRGKLYLDFGRHGKVWSLRGTPFETAEQAEQILRAIQGQVAQGTPRRLAVEGWLPIAARQNRVDRRLVLWLEDLEAQVASGERSPTYLTEIQRWARKGPHGYLAALGARSVQALDYSALRTWQRELVALGLHGKTLWNVTAGLGAFLGWLVKTGAIAVKPPIPWPRYDEHVPAIVHPEVQDRILDAIPEAERGVFLAMALLGLRHGEAFALDGRDYRDGRLWVRHARKGRALDAPVRGPKNRRPRVLPVPDELAEWIAVHVERKVLLAGGPLFVNPRTGGAWAASAFRRRWERACTAAGFARALNPYETLRHSTATEWLRRGASEREVQELLGHRTAHATPRYARLAEGRLATIVGQRDRKDRTPGDRRS